MARPALSRVTPLAHKATTMSDENVEAVEAVEAIEFEVGSTYCLTLKNGNTQHCATFVETTPKGHVFTGEAATLRFTAGDIVKADPDLGGCGACDG